RMCGEARLLAPSTPGVVECVERNERLASGQGRESMRVLHAIHDFLPRHPAGSEIYAFELARALTGRSDVFVLAAEYDPTTPHGTIRWRSHEGLVIVEIVNNWEFRGFHETYKSERMNAQ